MIYKLENLIPEIDSSCFIAPNATIIGQATLAANVSIWFNVVIRADMDIIKIGKNTNIQDGCILHVDKDIPMIIEKNVTVGHKVMLHGCNIGENTLIGMNAVVLNGAKVGKNCIVGANALITENMEIPDGSVVVGSPAKIIKEVNAATQEKLALSAAHYVNNGQRYKQHLEPME